MVKVLLMSHGNLCRGMLDTLQIFVSDVSHITAIPFYTQEELNPLEELEAYAKTIQENDLVLIFTDILWGSVNQKVMVELGSKDNVHVITGFNLPVILEIISAGEENLTHDSITQRVQQCRESIVYMKDYNIEFQDGDE